MQHVIVCVIVGVLLQWNNVEARPTTDELAKRYAELHPNTEGRKEVCQEIEVEGSDKEINPFNAASNPRLKWPQNTAHYTIVESGYTSNQISQIKAGIAELERLTAVNGKQCIKILPRKTETDYISISKGAGCSSSVGRIGGRQTMSLANGCLGKDTVMHEFLHAFGFQHEQKRTDRDSYVKINYDNIEPGKENNFQKLGSNVITLLGTPYDYSSVMHYGAYDFAVDRNIPTIIPYDKNAKIGQATTLSRIDIERVQIHYGCIKAADSVYFKHLNL